MKSLWRMIPVAMAGLVAWMGWSMVHRLHLELLWGWRPFGMMTGAWGVILSGCIGLSWHDPVRRRRWLLSSLSGVLLSLGFPPSPLTPLMFVGLVPLLMVEESLREQFGGAARRKMFTHAFNAFLIWNICTTWWVINTSFLPGIVANLANTLLMATVFVLFHQARSVLQPKLHPFVLAAFWIAFEYVHIHWEISWPWLTFGNSLAQYPTWIQWYEVTGVFGGSLWILLANFWIYKWYQTRPHPVGQLVWILVWIGVPLGWSVWRYATYPLQKGTVEVAVVQPNFEPHYEKFIVPQHEQLARFLKLSRDILTDSTCYLVYPETSFGFVRLNDIEDDYHIQALRQIIRDYPNLHIVTGLESYRVFKDHINLPSIREMHNRDGTAVYIDVQNSAIQVDQRDSIPVYFKSKLVPGAESFPYKDYLPFLKPIVDMLQGSIEGLTTQPTRTVFHTSCGNVAPVICYESVYGDYVGGYIRNGADMIFIMTNDGWWDKTPGHVQHLLFGALRAIEHRVPIARSANTGTSCFVNARGDILQPTKYGETTAIRAMLAPAESLTFYTRWGDIIARVAVFMAVLMLALTVTRSFVPGKGDMPES